MMTVTDVRRVFNWMGWILPLALAAVITGCGANAVAPNQVDDGTTTDADDNETTDATAAKAYVSAGGTAGLSIGTSDTGVAALAGFDPGAFVLAAATTGSSSESDEPVGQDITEPPPPPPPDGTTTTTPPPDGTTTTPPPDGTTTTPPPDGTTTTTPPPDGTTTTTPPPDGSLPPPPPPDGSLPPPPPPDGSLPPPPDGSLPPPPPPDGSVPPPPGTFPPPPDGTFFPPPPIPGLPGGTGFTFPDGTVPPPPPPEFQQFGMIDFTSPEFAAFAQQFTPPPGGVPGAPPLPGSPPPLTFAQFPFAEFLQNNPIEMIIPGVPPRFEPGAVFGQFTFGTVPPPPPGFPPFPPPPPPGGSAFGFFPPPPGTPPPPGGFPPGTPPPPGFGPLPLVPGGPIGPPPELPPGLPEEFYVFHDALLAMHEFLATQPFPPRGPLGEDGTFPGEGVEGVPPGIPFMFIDFESIAEFLPPGFLPPDAVTGAFENFGAGHPLIGEGGEVNPELEDALAEHPPIPPGFDGFDFQGDMAQFDDLFTVYNPEVAGQPLQGQVNATLTGVLDDGSETRTSDTTVIEAVPGQATPLIQMEPGVYQTQWVVDIHQSRTSHVVVQHPELGDNVEFDQTTETFSQMTWTMLIKEVDTDGDGVVDKIQTSGANVIEKIDETVEGEAPEGLPPLPPAPELLLPLQFQGVMGTSEASIEPQPSP